MADEIAKKTVKDVYLEILQDAEREATKLCSASTDPNKITALMANEAVKSPNLYECIKTPRGRISIMNFFMLAAQTGLEPGSAMQMLYAVPKQVKGDWTILPVIGYKGFCELAHRTGDIKRISANPFYEGEVGETLHISREPPDIKHEYDPSIEESDEKLVGVYTMVEMINGGKYILVMNKDKIVERAKRGGSFGATYSPWKTDFVAMARKTVIRSLLGGGLVPISREIRVALAEDGDGVQANDHMERTVVAQEAPPAKGRTSGSDDVRSALNIGHDTTVVDADFTEYGDESPFPDQPPTMT